MRRMSAPFFFLEHVVRTHHIRPELLTWQCGRTGSQVPHPSMVVVSNSFDKDSLQALLVRFVSHRFTSGKDVAEDSGGKAPFHDRRLSYSLPAMRGRPAIQNSTSLFTRLSLFPLSGINLECSSLHSYSSGFSGIYCLRVKGRSPRFMIFDHSRTSWSPCDRNLSGRGIHGTTFPRSV